MPDGAPLPDAGVIATDEASSDLPAVSDDLPAASEAPTTELEMATTGSAVADLVLADAAKSKRASRTVHRVQKTQEAASAAVGAAEDNPALGALNRHLNMLMQQLATAHRVIGRIAAERDALRQQLAEIQGVPVEEIKVTTIGASEERAQGERPYRPAAPKPTTESEASLTSLFNYFTVDDFEIMRRRRLGLAMAILAVVLVLWMAQNVGWIPRFEDFSRDTLGSIGILGNLMTFFLAGWLIYRVARVSSKGIRWVFPSEEQRRRRR
jgi:hypothetical protein